MSKAIIVSGGKKPSRSLFDKLLNENTYLIAVDKGAEFFREENIVPDLLVFYLNRFINNGGSLEGIECGRCHLERLHVSRR